jgi:methylated-DNA-[protein]-cysteine S-methyltransferase
MSAPAPYQNSPSGKPPFSAILPTAFGALGIIADSEYLHEIVFLPKGYAEQQPSGMPAEKAIRQLACYLADPDYRFELPLARHGSHFRHRTWAAIREIPLGETRTYSQLAKSLGSIARAVGQACGDNPFPIVTPCHRVVSASGIGGFAHHAEGFLIDTKRWLLQHEAAV